MKYFTKTISIIALAASLTTFGPNQMPTAANGWSLITQAEAANIKRTRLKQRRNGLYKTTIVTQTKPKDTVEAARLELQYDDGSSFTLFTAHSVTTTYVVQDSAVAVPAFIKYLRQSKTTEAKMNLNPVAEGNSSGGSSTSHFIAQEGSDALDGAITATTHLNPSGNLVIKLTGPADAMAAFKAANPVALSIGSKGEEIAAKYKNTQREWSCEASCQPKGGAGSAVITAYGAKGTVLDSSTVKVEPEKADAVEATDLSPEFGRNFISRSESGNLLYATSLIVPRQPSDTIRDDLIMGLVVTDEQTGKTLIDAKDVSLTSRESRAIWQNIEAVEPGNVIDREYIVTFDVYAPKSDVPEEISIRVRPDELSGENLTVNVFEDNVMLIGVGFGQNADGESLTLRAVASRDDGDRIIFEEPFEGPAPLVYQFVLSSVVSDDGGSDIEPEFLSLDASDEKLFFSAEGTAGIGSLSGAGGSFMLTKSTNCCGQTLGFLEITRGVISSGISAKPFGFGKGTKKSTTKATSRAELQ